MDKNAVSHVELWTKMLSACQIAEFFEMPGVTSPERSELWSLYLVHQNIVASFLPEFCQVRDWW